MLSGNFKVEDVGIGGVLFYSFLRTRYLKFRRVSSDF